MFNFFIKKPVVYLDFFTFDSVLFKYFKITPSIKFLPDWWKQLDPKFENMRHCKGFIEFYSKSFCVPSWCEFEFEVSENEGYKWQSGSNEAIVVEHNPVQYGNMFKDEKFYHFKINPNWICSTKDKNFRFLISPPFYNNKFLNNYQVMPGIIENYVNTSININFLMKRQNYKFSIMPYDPLAFFFPLTEKKIKLNFHLVSKKEYEDLHVRNKLFINRSQLLNNQPIVTKIFEKTKKFLNRHEEINN